MSFARSLPRLMLSLLVLLWVAARAEAQGIPLPSETPRAGTYTTPAVKARANKNAWRPKGSVVPAQAEESVSESEPAVEPTLAPPLEESAGEVQYLQAPANAVEQTAESGWQAGSEPRPAQTLPPRANPLRQASRPQPYPQHTPYQRAPSQYQRVQNPVEVELDVEVDAEPLPRPTAPRMLQELPPPGTRQPTREEWQVAPGQRYPAPSTRRFHPGEPEERHDWPADVDNPTALSRKANQFPHYPNSPRIVGEVNEHTGMLPDPRFVTPTDDGYNPADEQIPGQELYGLPRVFETNGYGRFTGRGEPLTAGSWLNRPYYVGGLIGGITGDTLVADEINANGAFFWALNLGWDYDPYWGLEMRLAHSQQGLDYLNNPAIDSQSNELLLWDTSFLYYPWGDARWRPYVKLGFGFADFDYHDATGIRRSEMVLEMPFGFGMKYRVNQYWTWRFDVTDNLIFGGNAGLETQNQFSLAAGLEYRFGGRRQSYWPWNPSRRWR